MKIGIECHTIEKQEKLGAGGNYLTNLLKEWSKLNSEKYHFFLYFKDRIPEDKILGSRVFKKRLIKNPLNIKSTALFYNLSMPLAAKRDKVDILFLPFYMRPFFCFNPTVTAIHDISYRVHPEWYTWNYKLPFRILSRLAIKTSRTIISCSEYTKREILKHYPVKWFRDRGASKIKVIYLAAGEKFNNKKDEDKIKKVKEKYGLTKKYLLYAGTIFNRRHALESIKAFELLLEKNQDYQFLISGRDFTRPAQKIDKEIEKINKKFQNAIIRVKYVDSDDLAAVYQGAELFVWPSDYEGFGLPVLEAMACGTPVLTTKKTSLAEVMGDYPLSIGSPVDINEINEKIQRALTDENLRKNMISKGLERANNFSLEKCSKETLHHLN